MRRREHRPRARYWMYFARKRLWKSLRIVSLTKVLPFFSGAPRAWWRKTTSSFQRLLTAPDGACVRINSKSKGAVKSLAGRRRVEERVRRGGGLGRRGLVLLAPPHFASLPFAAVGLSFHYGICLLQNIDFVSWW